MNKDYSQNEFAQHKDLIQRLYEYGDRNPLPNSVIEEFAKIAVAESRKTTDRRLMIRLTLICLACLPLVGLVNLFWGTIGFSFLNEYVSPFAAHVFSCFFAVSACAVTAICYGAIPLLAGISRANIQEKVYS